MTGFSLLFLLISGAYAQQQAMVNLTTAVLGPPYNLPFEQLAQKLRVTIISNTRYDGVYLTMMIRGDNGIVIQSNNNQTDLFNVPGSVPVIIPDIDKSFDIIFQQQNLSFSGVDPQIIYNYGLPAGHYQICFRLWSPTGTAGPVPLTLGAPSGCADFTIQQVNLNVSTVVVPPYTSGFLQYYDKVRVTLSSQQYTNLRLKLTLKGNNGITITTSPGYIPQVYTELQPNVPVILTGQDLWDYFNANNLVFSGILKQEVMDKGLPEGTYRLCFRAYNQNGVPLSGNDPAGCSSPFTLQLFEPPTILSPKCGDTLNQTTGQPLLFTWAPSPGAPPGTPYTLKIVEMTDPDVAPGDALLTATTPAFFETTVMNTSFLYGPAQPVLEKGKKYAFEVIAGTEALDITNPFDFDAAKLRFKNKGKSAPCYFVYGKSVNFQFFKITSSNNQGPIFSPIRPDPKILPYSTVTGQLNYKFKSTVINVNNTAGNLQVPGQASSGTSQSSQSLRSSVSMGNYGISNLNTKAAQTKLASSLGYIDPAGSKPLAGVPVSLVVRYVVNSGTINGKDAAGKAINKNDFYTIDDNDYYKNFKDDGTVLQTTYTDNNGKFSFTFVNADTTMGKLEKMSITHGGEMGDEASGRIYKTIRLIVGNKYYCSPDVDIIIKPWESSNLGTLVSWVKSYNLQLTVLSSKGTFYDQTSGSGTPLNGVKTKVLRGTLVPGVPFNEGDVKRRLMHIAGQKYAIEDGKTGMNGKVVFANLVMHDPDNNQDRYYIDCSTSETSGELNYKDAERRYNPIYLKDKKNFPFNSQGKDMVSSDNTGKADINLGAQYEYYGRDITFNSEFKVKTYKFTIQMYPKEPRIYGQATASGLRDLVNLDDVMKDTIMKGVKIFLFSKYKNADRIPASEKSFGNLTIQNTYTDARGYYAFNNLPLELKVKIVKENSKATIKGDVVGPNRWLVAKPKGFGLLEKQAGILKYGDQIPLNFSFLADGLLVGYVVDTDGNPVPADVKIEGYPALKTGKSTNFITAVAIWKTKTHGYGLPKNSEVFVFRAPSGKNQKITIIPHDLSTYLPVSRNIDISKFESKDPRILQKIVVKKLMHRVKFRIMGYANPPQHGNFRMISIPKPLKDVKVKVTNLLDSISGITDNNGFVTLEFVSSDTTFHLDVIPDETSDYPVEHSSFSNFPSGDVKFRKTFYLYPGYKIPGKVTIGDNDEPVDSAKVYVENNADIFAYTDKNGKYILKKVPGTMSSITVKAEKFEPGKTIIGDQKENISLPSSSPVDLHLKLANKIPGELFGFPIYVDSVQKQGNTTVISGYIRNTDKIKNSNFRLRLDPTYKIKFSGVKLVKKQGSNTLQPENNAVTLDMDKFQLEINKSFFGEQLPASGSLLKIEAGNGGKGLIRGKVRLSNSFKFNANLFSFEKDGAWLSEPGASNNTITVFRSPPETMAARKFALINKSGRNLDVTLKGFDGVASKGRSFLVGDTLSLSLTLTTKEIQGMNPSVIKVVLGNLKLTNTGFVPVNSSKPLSFNLEKWNVVSQNWTFSQQSKGIEIKSGTLKTGMVNLPVKNIVLTPTTFEINRIELNQITLAGVMPLTINSKDLSFGYFPSTGSDQKGHWRLAIVGLSGKPAVTLSGLPGIAAGENIQFQVFSMLSNGEQSIDLANQDKELTFYHILKVKPLAIIPYDGYFQLTGSMDMGIPRIEKQNGKIRFAKTGNSVEFMLYPLNMGFDGPGKVTFISSQKFGDQVFKNSVFTVPGVLNDPEGLSLKAVLHRDRQHAWVEVDPFNQKLPIGNANSTYLSDVKGEMRVDHSKKDWDYFTFNGIMNGVKGMEGDKKKTFTIFGDIVANDQQIQVSNINSGFGNINITYDFKHGRLIGNMNIDKDFASMSMHGVANLLVDHSGWYFLAGGQIEAPGLGDFQAGIMIGNYDVMPAGVTSKIMQFAYNKEIPKAFRNHISGMFITGRKTLPISIPDVSINLLILSVRLGVEAGLDARFWMGFDDSGNEYGIAAMAFAHAYFIASSITCTHLSADARAELGAKGTYNTGTGAFTIGGCGSITLSTRVEQCLPTLVAGCEGCIGKTFTESIKVNLSLDSQGHTDLSFGFGNCSGQSTLSSGF